MSTRARTVLRILVGVAAVGAVLWYLRTRDQSASHAAVPGEKGSAGSTGSGDRVVSVQVAVAKKQDLPIWLDGLGTVAAFQQVTVRFQVDGRLDKVLFNEGQTVNSGDVIAQIDPRPFLVQLHNAQGALARDRAQLATSKHNYDRYKVLHEQNLVADQQVDQYAGEVGQFHGSIAIDQSQVEAAQLQLDYAKVKAPLTGITGLRQVDAGNVVHQADANGLVVITAMDPAAVLFTVPQDKLAAITGALEKGEVSVEVFSRDGVTQIGKGTLTVIDNTVNLATSTLRLKALVANPTHALWPNAFVKARVLVDTRKGALVVPTVAIQNGPQGTFVYVVGDDKTAQMKPVVVATSVGDLSVIDKGGVKSGEQVVIEGQNQLKPGGRVEVAQAGEGGKGKGGKGKGGKGKGDKSDKTDKPDQGGGKADNAADDAAAPAGAKGDGAGSDGGSETSAPGGGNGGKGKGKGKAKGGGTGTAEPDPASAAPAAATAPATKPGAPAAPPASSAAAAPSSPAANPAPVKSGKGKHGGKHAGAAGAGSAASEAPVP